VAITGSSKDNPSNAFGKKLSPQLIFWIQGYLEQIFTLLSLFLFNTILPWLVGLNVFGQYTVVAAAIWLLVSLLGGGLDIFILRVADEARGQVPRNTLRKVVAIKTVSMICAGIFLYVFRYSVFDSSVDIGFSEILLLLPLLLGSNSLLVNTLSSSRRNDIVARITILFALPYFILPLIACKYYGSSVSSILVGLTLWYIPKLTVMAIYVKRLPEANVCGSELGMSEIIPSAGVYSWFLLFNSLRSWFVFYVGQYTLGSAELGVSRVCFSVSLGLCGLIPIPMNSLVTSAGHFRDKAQDMAMLVGAARVGSVVAALGTIIVCVVLGMTIYRSEERVFYELAPWAGLIALIYRVACLGEVFAIAHLSRRRLLFTLLLLICIVLAAGIIQRGIKGPLLAIALVGLLEMLLVSRKYLRDLWRLLDICVIVCGNIAAIIISLSGHRHITIIMLAILFVVMVIYIVCRRGSFVSFLSLLRVGGKGILRGET
jgi:hypothetical protein